MGELARIQLPPDTVALLDLLFERLDMGNGPWKLEAQARDGRVESIRRHDGPIGRVAIVQRFDDEGGTP